MTEHFTRSTVSSAALRLVRARLKPLDEIPDEFFCCERIRQRFMDTRDDVLEAIPDALFVAEIECPFCHRILDEVKYVRVRRSGNSRATCIAVACYEFDEGAA